VLLRKLELDFVVTSRRVSTGYAIEGLTILAHLDPFLKDALLAGFKALIDCFTLAQTAKICENHTATPQVYARLVTAQIYTLYTQV
jgi:hypothetical protein